MKETQMTSPSTSPSKKVSPQQPRTAGKQPTLRPKSEVQPAPAHTFQSYKVSTSKAKKTLKAISQPSHTMRTRSKAQVFRLMDLPAEIRNSIYTHACLALAPAPRPLDLSTLKLPPQLSLSREVRSEALPVLFASRIFSVLVRSNWCVRNKHFHDYHHHLYGEAGIIDLPPFLQPGNDALPENTVRFKHVEFTILCACCDPGMGMGSLVLKVDGVVPVIENKSPLMEVESKKALHTMVENVEELMKVFGAREVFNGFGVEDIVHVGACFKHVYDGISEHF